MTEGDPGRIDHALYLLDMMSRMDRINSIAKELANARMFDGLKQDGADGLNAAIQEYTEAHAPALDQAGLELAAGVTLTRQRQIDELLDNWPPQQIDPQAWKKELDQLSPSPIIAYADLLRVIAHDPIALRQAERRNFDPECYLSQRVVHELLQCSRRPLTLYSDERLSAERHEVPTGVTVLERMTILQAFKRYGSEGLLHRMGVER